MRDPRIIVQNSDPRFLQQNPRMVRILRTLRLTYIHVILCNKQQYYYIYIRYTLKKTFHTVALNRGNAVRPFKKPVEQASGEMTL